MDKFNVGSSPISSQNNSTIQSATSHRDRKYLEAQLFQDDYFSQSLIHHNEIQSSHHMPPQEDSYHHGVHGRSLLMKAHSAVQQDDQYHRFSHGINIPIGLGNSMKDPHMTPVIFTSSQPQNLGRLQSSSSRSTPLSVSSSAPHSPQMSRQLSPNQHPTTSVTPNQGQYNPTDANDNVFVVSFKRISKDYVLGVRVPTKILVGDAVIVSSDRGEDLGFVTRIMAMSEYLTERFRNTFIPDFDIKHYVGRILRAATPRESRMLGMKTHDEEEVLKYARHIAYNVYNLNIQLFDAEYQFDRFKITIYYDAVRRVDFRDFVKDLYSTFNARVWMERVTNNNSCDSSNKSNSNSTSHMSSHH